MPCLENEQGEQIHGQQLLQKYRVQQVFKGVMGNKVKYILSGKEEDITLYIKKIHHIPGKKWIENDQYLGGELENKLNVKEGVLCTSQVSLIQSNDQFQMTVE